MDFNFPLILVLATFASGLIWLADVIMFAPHRRKVAEAQCENPTEGEGSGDGSETVAVPEPLLVEYARSFFPVFLAVLILRSFLVEPFRIPSSSMMPTLLVGDFILVNKFAYGVRLPVIHTKILDTGGPQRGDVFVFRFPEDPSTDYIKRVAGVPGDRVAYRNKRLYINDQPLPQTPIGRYSGVGEGAKETGTLQNIETIDGLEHAILVNPRKGDFPGGCQVLARGPVTVPEGHYFAIGDNRDNSKDSRCWGFVPEENLVGKAFAIWMSWDWSRPGFPIAWERLGEGIE